MSTKQFVIKRKTLTVCHREQAVRAALSCSHEDRKAAEEVVSRDIRSALPGGSPAYPREEVPRTDDAVVDSAADKDRLPRLRPTVCWN